MQFLDIKTIGGSILNRESHDELLNDNEKREIIPLYNDYKANIIISGPSKSGKTSFLIDLLLNEQNRHEIVTIIAPKKSLEQGKYQNLINDENIIGYESDTRYGIPSPKEILNPDKINIVIFDDILDANKKQNINMIEEYLTNGSRYNCSVYLLLQALKELPPRYRNQCKIWCLSAQSSVLELNEAFDDVFNGDFTKQEIAQIIRILKKKENRYKMLICNANFPVEEGRYRIDDLYIKKEKEPEFRIPK